MESASVTAASFARLVGLSGIYAAKIVTESEAKLNSTTLRDLTMKMYETPGVSPVTVVDCVIIPLANTT
jgi:hypothetical protein